MYVEINVFELVTMLRTEDTNQVINPVDRRHFSEISATSLVLNRSHTVINEAIFTADEVDDSIFRFNCSEGRVNYSKIFQHLVGMISHH